jgi:hypothetical protein
VAPQPKEIQVIKNTWLNKTGSLSWGCKPLSSQSISHYHNYYSHQHPRFVALNFFIYFFLSVASFRFNFYSLKVVNAFMRTICCTNILHIGLRIHYQIPIPFGGTIHLSKKSSIKIISLIQREIIITSRQLEWASIKRVSLHDTSLPLNMWTCHISMGKLYSFRCV